MQKTAKDQDHIFDAAPNSLVAAGEEIEKVHRPMQLNKSLIHRSRRWVIKIIVSVVAVGLTTLLHAVVWGAVTQPIFILYFPAIIFSSVYGSGLAAVGLSVLAAEFFFVPPYHSFQWIVPLDLGRALTFVVSGVLINVVISVLAKARKMAESAWVEQNKARQEAERKHQAAIRSEEEFRAFFSLAAAGKAIVEVHSGRLCRVNPGLASMLGYEEDELLSLGLQEIFHPEERASLIPQVWFEQQNGCTLQKRLLGKNGGTVWVMCSQALLPQMANESLKAVITIHNITELKKTQDELLQAISRLEEERGLREQFVTMLTHDLRSPLTAAKMSVDLYRRYSPISHSASHLLDHVRKSLARADDMIQNLLDANRIQAGKPLPLELESCDFAATLRELMEDMRVVYGDRFDVIAPSHCAGRWNATGLRRIIENLITNAVKYGDVSRLITIKLICEPHSASLLVHNWGPLISPEEQKRLFKIFHRSDNARESGQRGWGIGLTLVRGLCEAMGGTISVESSACSGTTFSVTLPLEVEHEG